MECDPKSNLGTRGGEVHPRGGRAVRERPTRQLIRQIVLARARAALVVADRNPVPDLVIPERLVEAERPVDRLGPVQLVVRDRVAAVGVGGGGEIHGDAASIWWGNVFAHRLTLDQIPETTFSLSSAKIRQTTDGSIANQCYDSLCKVVVRNFAQDEMQFQAIS